MNSMDDNTGTQEGQKITLEDLYGPSKPQELQQAVAQPVQPEVVQPEVVRRNVEVQPEVPVSQPPEPSHEEGSHLPLLKFIVGGILLLIVASLIWGVGSLIFSGKNATGGNGKVTLTYWGLWEDKNVMQPILDDFHQKYPNVTVTYIQQDPKDYTKRLLTRMQEGSGPDIFRFHNTWVYPLQSVLLPLPTSVIDAKTLQANYPPVASTDLVRNGAVYGLPLQMDVLSLFVNTDIFTHAGATVPTTWDNFITVAKGLTVKDPTGHIQTAGAALGTYNNISHAPDIISLLLLQNGANLEKLDNSTNTNDALSFYTSFATGDGNVWDATLDNSLLAFSRGKLAMYFGYSYDVFAIQAASPQLKFSVYPVPHLQGRNIDIASYWVEGVSNRSKHQKEALEFMQYLAQKETSAKLYTEETKTRSFGELYALSSLATSLTANSLLKPFVDQFKDAASSFFAADTNYDEYNGALNQYLGNAIGSMLTGTSAESASATLAQGVTQVRNTFAPAVGK